MGCLQYFLDPRSKFSEPWPLSTDILSVFYYFHVADRSRKILLRKKQPKYELCLRSLMKFLFDIYAVIETKGTLCTVRRVKKWGIQLTENYYFVHRALVRAYQ